MEIKLHRINISWSFLGLAIPSLVAVLTIPFLLAQLGNERFGFLGLIWALTSFGGIFDLGLGRAAIFFISDRLGKNKYDEIPKIYYAAQNLTLLAGSFGGLLVIIAAILELYTFINYSSIEDKEIYISMLLVAFMIPMQALISAFRGVNEAFQQFKLITFIRILNGVITFLGPYIIAIWSTNLILIVLPLFLAKFITVILSKIVSYNSLKKLNYKEKDHDNISMDIYLRMIKFGGWATLSMIISPIMVQADRFFIGVFLSAAAIGIYVLPMEVISQTLIIIGSITTVMYPVFSKSISEDFEFGFKLYERYSQKITFLLFALYSIIFLILPKAFNLWLGEVSPQTINIAQILCIGALLNSLTGLKYSMIQAMGRADICAKIHIVELPIYILIVTYLINSVGLIGVAIAWSLRMFLDLILMSYALNKVSVDYLKN